jgi:hypothetical protein
LSDLVFTGYSIGACSNVSGFIPGVAIDFKKMKHFGSEKKHETRLEQG